MTSNLTTQQAPATQWGPVALAWAMVGVPLVWGVWNTLLKASALFE